jgi:large subunit ribosomal protein L10
VVKNSLTERAADKAGASELKELLDGPTALTLVSGDPALAAKALSDTARALQILDFKGGLMNGNALTADEIRSIARLPSRDILHGQLVGSIAAPLSGLVRTLNALLAGLAVQLQQIADQGLVSSPTPEAPTPEPDAAVETEEGARAASDANETQREAVETEQPAAEAAEAEQPAAEAAEAEQAQATEPEPEETPSDDESDAKED